MLPETTQYCLRVCSDYFLIFLSNYRVLYHRKAHVLLITSAKCQAKLMLFLCYERKSGELLQFCMQIISPLHCNWISWLWPWPSRQVLLKLYKFKCGILMMLYHIRLENIHWTIMSQVPLITIILGSHLHSNHFPISATYRDMWR